MVPKIIDYSLIAPNKSSYALNVRFDQGGLVPIHNDEYVQSLISNNTVVSMFPYWNGNNRVFFTWTTDVDAVKTPLPNDSYNRVFYTEGGILKVTDGNIYDGNNNNTTIFPSNFKLPCPPAPVGSILPMVAIPPANLFLIDNAANASANNSNDASHNGQNAADGDVSTFWKSTALNRASATDKTSIKNGAIGGNNMCWWQYDHGANVANAVNRLEITYNNTTSGAGTCGPGSFLVLGSNDNNNWTTLHQVSGLTPSVWNAAGNSTLSWNWTAPVDNNGNQIPYRYTRLLITQGSCPGVVPDVEGKKMCIQEVALLWIPTQPDPTLKEKRAYTYTFVNDYGQEGPPALIPQEYYVDCYDGDTVYVDGMDTSLAPSGNINSNINTYITNNISNNATTLGNLFDIKHVNIYRTNQLASGASQFQLVDQIDYPPTTNNTTGHQFTDTVLDAALGLVLPSEDWGMAPDGISGLISLPNGVVAGFVSNLLCLTPKYYPHAWPASQQYPVDRKIVGLGAFGTSIVVLTEGNPYLFVCNDPANVVWEKLDHVFSCISKKSIAHVGSMVVYASPEGLIGIGPNGLENLTHDIITPKQWSYNYNPATMLGFQWEGKYVAFFTTPYLQVTGLIFDPKTKDLVYLDSYATTGCYDTTDGILYLGIQSSGNTVAWVNNNNNTITWTDANNNNNNNGNNIGWVSGGNFIMAFARAWSNRSYLYMTKTYKIPPTSFGAARVIGQYGEKTLSVVDFNSTYWEFYDVSIYTPFRLAGRVLIDSPHIQISGNTAIDAIYLAGTMEELPL